MKKLILPVCFFLWSGLVFAQEESIEVSNGYQVSIQTSAICEMCKEAIEYDLAFEKGVKSADLDLETKKVTVVFNPKKTDAETIRKRIAMVGYHADDFKRDSAAYEKLPFCCKDGGMSHGGGH